MGQRTRLSKLDVKKMNIMYGCENKPEIKPENKFEIKPEIKPENKPEIKPESKRLCGCIPQRQNHDLREGFYFLE